MDEYRFPRTIDDSSCSFVRSRVNEEFIVDIEECLKLQTKEEKVWDNKVDFWRYYVGHPIIFPYRDIVQNMKKTKFSSDIFYIKK